MFNLQAMYVATRLTTHIMRFLVDCKLAACKRCQLVIIVAGADFFTLALYKTNTFEEPSGYQLDNYGDLFI